MNTISEYKQMLDKGNRRERIATISLIKDDNSIDYIDRQGLLSYGYMKNNLFEDAFDCIKNIVNYNLYNLNREKIELPKILKMADGHWIIAFVEEGTEGGDCCCCCCGPLFCMGCLSDCGCLGPFVEYNPGLMAIGDCMAKLIECNFACACAPLECLCGDKFGPS